MADFRNSNECKGVDYMGGKGKFIFAGLLIVAAVAYLIVSSTGQSAHRFVTIEELTEMGDEAIGTNTTISGAVLGDTIVYDDSIPQVTFTIAQVPGTMEEIEAAGGLAQVLAEAVNNPNAPRMEIVLQDIKPDLLQHEAQAIIRGQLHDDGRFYAEEVLLKCPTRYEEALPEQAEGA
jgi:cytochrome c-type biogenesis protein CcmE